MDKEYFMKQALKEAKKAYKKEEIPVGAVIVKNGEIIAKAHNLKETKNSSISHAEILAIEKANKKLGAWRLEDCDIYITLEPCIMCAGAIIQGRFKRVIYGAKDYKGGAFGSSIDVMQAQNINHHPEIVGGILEQECSSLLTNYFKKKR